MQIIGIDGKIKFICEKPIPNTSLHKFIKSNELFDFFIYGFELKLMFVEVRLNNLQTIVNDWIDTYPL